MNWKRILLDPSLWILIIANIFLVYNYERNPTIFTTLIWLYWSQNVLYGFFNFLAMTSSRNVNVTGYGITGKSPQDDMKIASDAGWGFLFIFGFFHFVYLIFVATMAKSGPFQWGFYKEYFLAFLMLQVLNFIQVKFQNHEVPLNITKMSYMPYLRAIPMHLCILIPAFLNFSSLTIFLIVKVVIDIFTYLLTTTYYRKKDLLTEATAVNIGATM